MPEGARQLPSYFMYFPEDYRWSAAVINVLGAGSYGAADIGEVDRIGRMLRGKEGDDAAWFDAWCEVAARVRALAQRAPRRGDIGCRTRAPRRFAGGRRADVPPRKSS